MCIKLRTHPYWGVPTGVRTFGTKVCVEPKSILAHTVTANMHEVDTF